MEEIKYLLWFGHASFSFVDETNGSRIYYVDPFDLRDRMLKKADLIFITHAHFDHNSEEDLKKIVKSDTVIIAPDNVLSKISLSSEKFPIEPNKSYEIKSFHFQTIPAYNTKTERLSYHPKSNNWVGYILNINDKKIYHSGDTDFIPEMKELKSLNLDIAMLPIGGTYTMDVNEAVEAASAICAKTTIPMHYKRLLGENYKQAENTFKEKVINSKVVILIETQ